MRNWLIIVLCLVLLSSCDKKKDEPDLLPELPKAEGSVYILNEGNFQYGNASITVVNKNDYKVFDNVFETTNKRSLGDVLQSMTVVNGLGYLVVNNSAKIEVIDPENYTSTATITGFTSPRYMVALNDAKAYVSEYYANAIRVVDLKTNQITSSISMPGWADEMLIGNDSRLYITNANRNQLLVVNTVTDQITDSITLGDDPNSIVMDANNKLWVLCNGNQQKNSKPSLHKIDPATKQVQASYVFGDVQTGAMRLRVNATRTKIYWLAEHVYAMDVNDSQFPSDKFIDGSNGRFYGLGIDPYTDEIYVSDAVDFVQKSNIFRYHSDGSMKGQFKAGIISGGFFFYKK